MANQVNERLGTISGWNRGCVLFILGIETLQGKQVRQVVILDDAVEHALHSSESSWGAAEPHIRLVRTRYYVKAVRIKMGEPAA